MRVPLFHSTEMVPRSSVEYVRSARAMDFTSPVIRSPFRIQTESVFCAVAVVADDIASSEPAVHRAMPDVRRRGHGVIREMLSEACASATLASAALATWTLVAWGSR